MTAVVDLRANDPEGRGGWSTCGTKLKVLRVNGRRGQLRREKKRLWCITGGLRRRKIKEIECREKRENGKEKEEILLGVAMGSARDRETESPTKKA